MQRSTRWVGALMVVGAATISGALVTHALTPIAGAATVHASADRVDPPQESYVAPELRGVYEVVVLVNAERARRGLPALTWNEQVASAAQAHSEDMAAHGRMQHAGSDGSSVGDRLQRAGFTWTSCGEDIAAGQFTAEAVYLAWMGSAPHRQIMLGNFAYVGVGAAAGADGTPFWTLDVAT